MTDDDVQVLACLAIDLAHNYRKMVDARHDDEPTKLVGLMLEHWRIVEAITSTVEKSP